MTDTKRLLVSRRVFPEVLERLSPCYEIVSNQDDEDWSAEALRERALDRDALFVVATDRVDAALIDAAPGVRIIATASVGYNHIDLQTCAARGIVVTNTPDVLTEATADMAWTLLMAAARRVTESERWLRAGHWKRWAFEQFLGADVGGTTLGIIGMGRIGSAIARRASGFGMTILYNNRRRAANESELNARFVERDELLGEADHVVLVLPYSQASQHTIGAAELLRMKPSATLVNIARGGIVDDRALAAALREGRIGAAGLDVYENEPALHPELLEAPRIVLTPHIGSATETSRRAMAMLAADNLVAFAEGRPLPTPVQTSR